MINKKFNTAITIIGMLIGLAAIMLFLLNDFLPVAVVKAIPLVMFALIELLIFVTAIQMLFSKHIIGKLSALPMILVMFLVAYFLINMPIYKLLMSSILAEPYEIDSTQMFDVMGKGFKYFHIGIWISVAPVFIAGLWTMKKSTQKLPKNIGEFYPTQAKVLSCGFTDVVINNIPVYKLELEVAHYEGVYTITKEIRIRTYTLLGFSKDSYVDVLVDPDNKNKVYVKDDNNIY